MFADFQEALLIAFGPLLTWELSATVAGVFLLVFIVAGLGILKRIRD
jgi:hypothetical protein